MKIATLFLACMTWIQLTISAPLSSDDRETQSMFDALMSKSDTFEDARRRGHPFHISNKDFIAIHKVINGHFAPHDVIHGNLFQVGLRQNARVRRQHGEVDVYLSAEVHAFHASLTKQTGYEDLGSNLGQAEYFCYIETSPGYMHTVGVLRRTGSVRVPRNVPQVVFKNHAHLSPQDVTFTAELFTATPQNVETLLRSFKHVKPEDEQLMIRDH